MVGRGSDGHRWGFGGGMVGFHIYSPPRGKRKSCRNNQPKQSYTSKKWANGRSGQKYDLVLLVDMDIGIRVLLVM